jgi:DNA-binding MarR family transcriptional regulator
MRTPQRAGRLHEPTLYASPCSHRHHQRTSQSRRSDDQAIPDHARNARVTLRVERANPYGAHSDADEADGLLAWQYGDIVISEIVKSEMVAPATSTLLSLQRATHAVGHHLAIALLDLDLSASEINALANLGDGRGRTISQLASASGAPPTTLTSLLDRLERRGYVTRRPRTDDRRSVIVELTDSGRAAAAQIIHTVTGLEHHLMRDLPREVVAGFRTVLDRLSVEES